MKGLNLISSAAGLFLLVFLQIAQAGSVTYMKGSDGSNAHQYKNPCKVWVKADPGMVVWKTLYLEPRSYALPITIGAAAGWKIVSAKYKNSSGQNVTLTPPTAAAAISWAFSISKNLAGAFDGKILTVHFATQRQTPSGRPDYEEDIIVYATVVSSLATLDADGNRLYDQWEIQYFGSVAQDPYGDPDKDGLSNLQEMQNGTDPLHFTDTLYTTDSDSDHDNLPDWWEMAHFGMLSKTGSTIVADSGGLTVQQLYTYYVQQSQNSTVGDGIPDSWKQSHGIDVNDPDAANKDPDNDGLSNADEYDAQLDPKKPDYDNDGIYDGQDLYPRDKNITSAQSPQIVVPSWDQESQKPNPDYSKVDYTKIELRWEAATNGPSGYIIERRINSDAWQQVSTVSALKYPDSGLLANQHYQYRITAYKNISIGKMLSEPILLDYEVPAILSIDVKSSYLSRGKQYFSEFTNPSTPPKYYLVKTSTGSSTQTSSSSSGGSSSSADYSYVTEVDPAAHSRKDTGSYSNSYHSSYSSNGSGSTSDSSATSSYSSLNIDRTKSDLSSHNSATSSYHSSSSSSWWDRYSSGSSSSSSGNSGNYLSEGKYVADDGSPLWAGNDYDMSLGKVTWSGNSSYSSQSSSSSGSPYSYSGQATENPNGSWTGSYSGTSGSGSLSGAPYYGGWSASWPGGSYQGSTPTQITYSSSSTGYSAHGSDVLSKEYTTDNLIKDTIADLPDYPKEWSQNWYGWGNYSWGYWGYDSWGYWGSWYTYGYPWYGWWLSERNLSKNEASFSVGKMKYRFRGSPSIPYTLKWDEIFVPYDDPDTQGVDESKNIKIIRHCSWPVSQGTTTSPEFEITKATTEPENGYYTILVQPVHIGVGGIGEAGKDKTGDDANPGKVVLINDGDVDNDGIPDYADGYKLSPQIQEEETCYGSSFTPIGIALVATDPQHAKIRFTYSSSDPKQVTPSGDVPFKLATSGAIRVWTKDGSQERDGRDVKSGGDFIKPGVDYTFEDLGLTYSSFLSCYVEAVKTSSGVADIPIKVEVDPTGNLGYVWSDQLRFTAANIGIVGRQYKEINYSNAATFVPSRLRDFNTFTSVYDSPPGSFQIYKLQITDPRKTRLIVSDINGNKINITSKGNIWESEDFVFIRGDSPVDPTHTSIRRIPFSDQQFSVSYNGLEIWDWLTGATPPSRAVTDVDDAIQDIQKKLEASGFDPGSQSYGNAAHAELSTRYAGQPHWLVNVYTDRVTNKVVSVGKILTPGTTPPINGTTQIDLMYTKRGYVPTVGQPLQSEQILHVFDAKTALDIRKTKDMEDQILRLQKATGKGPEGIHLIQSKRVVRGGRWIENPKYVRGGKLIRFVGGLSIASMLIGTVQANDKLDVIVEKIQDYRTKYRGRYDDAEASLPRYEIAKDIHDWLSMFSPTDLPVNLGMLPIFKWVVDDPEDTTFDYNPDAD